MGIMDGKKGIIFGVSNKWGIAYAIAKALHREGAQLAIPYFGEAMKDRVTPIAQELGAKVIRSCDVTKEEEIQDTFSDYDKEMGQLDFMVHAVAFANKEDLKGGFSGVSREGFDLALGVSCYTFIAVSRAASTRMKEGGSIVTLSYIGGEKAVPNYNVMGVAKSALESSVRYLASELGPQNIRVNALSAGPIKTLAAKGISGFDTLSKVVQVRSPLKRGVTLDEVGNSGLYLCSDWSSGVTGEVHHVDCGFHSIAGSPEDGRILSQE